MNTAFRVLRPSARALRREMDAPLLLSPLLIALICVPYLGPGFRPVRVQEAGQPCDLFVSLRANERLGGSSPATFNPDATALYRAALRAEYPEADPDSLPAILGPAVLFERRVTP